MNLVLGIMIPFLGTAAGAACVFFLRGEMRPALQKTLLGFASGVMVAAAVWSLLIPSMDMSEGMGKLAFVPAAVGFLLGILFLLVLDRVIPHLHLGQEEPEGPRAALAKNMMLVLAVTLHNIPEGMAVGVVFAGMLQEGSEITAAAAFALAIGIAIQNFPEGAIISMPLAGSIADQEGLGTGGKEEPLLNKRKWKAFGLGVVSGIVEPVGAVLTILLSGLIVPVLPYLLSFAAGAMVYVVVEELIPESAAGKHSNLGTIGFAAGFVIMMILDVALG